MEGVCAHGRGGGSKRYLKSLPTQTLLGFHDFWLFNLSQFFLIIKFKSIVLFFWNNTQKSFLSQMSWNETRKGTKYALKIYTEGLWWMTLQLEVKKMLKACCPFNGGSNSDLFFSPCRNRYTGTLKWMHRGSAKCVSNCLSLIIDNIDRACKFFFHIKDNCAWVLHSLKLNVLSAPGTSMYVLWKIIPLDKELEYIISFIYLDCSDIQRAEAGLESQGDRWCQFYSP